MKILWYIKNYNTPMTKWHNYQEYDELKRHGITIDFFDGLRFEDTDQSNEALAEYIRENRDYDLFVCAYAETEVYIVTLDEIRRLGVPMLLICYDNLLIPYRHKNVCALYDLVWITSIETKYLFDKWGAKNIFLPYAANPYNPYRADWEEWKGVVFIGSPYGSRANIINHLLENKIPVFLFTGMYKSTEQNLNMTKIINEQDADKKNNTVVPKQTKKQDNKINLFRQIHEDMTFPIGRKVMYVAFMQKIKKQEGINIDSPLLEIYPPLSFEDMYKTHHIAGLDLASTAARNTGILKQPVDVINLRNFEIPMSGGIEFCKYNREMADYFEDGKEIVFYRTDEEMIDKAKYYLAPERRAERDGIRLAARKRAESKHTWFCRFEKVFKEMGIKL